MYTIEDFSQELSNQKILPDNLDIKNTKFREIITELIKPEFQGFKIEFRDKIQTFGLEEIITIGKKFENIYGKIIFTGYDDFDGGTYATLDFNLYMRSKFYENDSNHNRALNIATTDDIMSKYFQMPKHKPTSVLDNQRKGNLSKERISLILDSDSEFPIKPYFGVIKNLLNPVNYITH